MKMTKVIREYMNETLSKKRLAVDKEARADYDARRMACIKEIETVRNGLRKEVEDILRKYNMDTEYLSFDRRSVFEELFLARNTYIQNAEEKRILDKADDERYKVQEQAMKDIELEMALGGDKAKLMGMLESIKFE